MDDIDRVGLCVDDHLVPDDFFYFGLDIGDMMVDIDLFDSNYLLPLGDHLFDNLGDRDNVGNFIRHIDR